MPPNFLKSWSSKRLSLKPGDEGMVLASSTCQELQNARESGFEDEAWVLGFAEFLSKVKAIFPFLKKKGRDTSKIQRGSNCKRIFCEESFPSLFQEYFLYLSLASYICVFFSFSVVGAGAQHVSTSQLGGAHGLCT